MCSCPNELTLEQAIQNTKDMILEDLPMDYWKLGEKEIVISDCVKSLSIVLSAAEKWAATKWGYYDGGYDGALAYLLVEKNTTVVEEYRKAQVSRGSNQ